MRFTTNHAIMLGCSVIAAAAETANAYAVAGNHLPFHMTAGACLAVVTVMGSVSKSVLADKDAPTSTLTADMLQAVAKSLVNSAPTTLHVAVLDAVKQTVAVDAEVVAKAKASEPPPAPAGK
jgi:hypothetical protein